MTSAPRRILLNHAPPEAFAPMTRAILGKLGYAIVPPEELHAMDLPRGFPVPAVRLVDERQLGEVPDEDQPIPIVVLTGRHGASGADPRIVGAVRRPAGMHELYRLVQQITEDTPRSTPRIATHLAARCRLGNSEWGVTVLSLSENGCLVRTPEPLLLGVRVGINFVLRPVGRLEFEAETAYQLLPDVGMIFHATPARYRAIVSDYITKALAA